MKNSIFERGAQGCVTTCPPFIYSNTANRSPFSDGPFIVASTRLPNPCVMRLHYICTELKLGTKLIRSLRLL